jgi:hypothetical protein
MLGTACATRRLLTPPERFSIAEFVATLTIPSSAALVPLNQKVGLQSRTDGCEIYPQPQTCEKPTYTYGRSVKSCQS